MTDEQNHREDSVATDSEASTTDVENGTNAPALSEVVQGWTTTRLLNQVRAQMTGDRLAGWLLLSISVGLIVPFLGSFGFFDPWESHYGEVARQMAVRDDHLYPFWKDAHFFSKPVLLFWTTSIGYRLIGAGNVEGRLPDATEWIGRAPMAVFSILCLMIMFHCARRLWGRRAALISGIVLATCPYWYFMSRQAITDMLYVAPMSAALLLLAVAFLDDDGAKEREEMRIPLWLTGFFGLVLLPQLMEIGRSGAFLNRVAWLGSELATRIGVMVVLVAIGAGGLYWLHRKGRDPYVLGAAALVGLATLGKGPHALLFTGLVLFLYFLTTGEWSRLRRPALIPGIALYLAVALPWYVVMFFFKGLGEGRKTWFERFVLYDLLGRVGAGVHGDRATFEYYIRYFAFGIFPWSIFAPIAVIQTLLKRLPRRQLRTNEDRFTHFVALWAIALFVFFSAMTTKFHHYAFPIAVPVALLIGIWLEGALRSERRLPLGLAVGAVLGTLLIARDLVKEPWQFVDLFTYHYKSYKPEYYFPPVATWSTAIGVLALAAVLLFLGGLLGDIILERLRDGDESARAEGRAKPSPLSSSSPALLTVAFFVIGAAVGVWAMLKPVAAARGWNIADPKSIGPPLAAAVIGALVVAVVVGFVAARKSAGKSLVQSFRGLFVRMALLGEVVMSPSARSGNSGMTVMLLIGALLFSVFGAQVYLPQMSQHWSQRHLIDTYYEMRHVGEPLISFQMDWKGETFYAHNSEIQIKKSREDLKKAVKKPGREFILVQQDRFKSIGAALGKEFESKIQVVDRSNVKWFLVMVDE